VTTPVTERSLKPIPLILGFRSNLALVLALIILKGIYRKNRKIVLQINPEISSIHKRLLGCICKLSICRVVLEPKIKHKGIEFCFVSLRRCGVMNLTVIVSKSEKYRNGWEVGCEELLHQSMSLLERLVVSLSDV
jgi:hypothetical protein